MHSKIMQEDPKETTKEENRRSCCLSLYNILSDISSDLHILLIYSQYLVRETFLPPFYR